MLSVNVNTTALSTMRHLNMSSSAIKTSIERLSTGYKINRAADNASNLSISKKMGTQLSGTQVAQENAQQAIALLDTADGALDEMTSIANRIRDLSLQSMNGTYSEKERSIMQEEVNKLTIELYRQRNSTKYNKMNIFGEVEIPTDSGFSGGGATSNGGIATVSATSQGSVGTYAVDKLTEAEAIAQGYTVIKTADDLAAMGSSGKFILMGDIDLSGKTWAGKTLNTGAEFNGNGYEIKNLKGSQGLFSTNSGTIKNVTLTNVDVSGSANNIGGLAGQNLGIVENVYVDGVVNGGSYAGMLVGYSGGTSVIKNVSVSGNTIATARAGGVSGENFGKIQYAFADVDINTSAGEGWAGGLVGNNKGVIDNSCALGDVVSTGNKIGGFCGESNSTSITNSYATGDVKGNGGAVAGFVGYVYAGGNTISNCYSTGDVTSNYACGGFIGEVSNGNGLSVSNSYTTGNVNSTSTGAGAFIGGNASNAIIKDCLANSEQLSNIKVNQTNVTTVSPEEMKSIETYQNAGWDISEYDGQNAPTTTWFMKDGELPQLAWEWEATPLQPEPEKTLDSVDFQIGANSGENNMLNVDLGFSLNNFQGDITSIESASDTLNAVDELKKTLNEKRSEIGVSRNRIDGIIESQSIKIENLSASHSTIVDTDFAQESATLVKSQILQQATSSLLKQANITQQLALQLLQ